MSRNHRRYAPLVEEVALRPSRDHRCAVSAALITTVVSIVE